MKTLIALLIITSAAFADVEINSLTQVKVDGSPAGDLCSAIRSHSGRDADFTDALEKWYASQTKSLNEQITALKSDTWIKTSPTPDTAALTATAQQFAAIRAGITALVTVPEGFGWPSADVESIIATSKGEDYGVTLTYTDGKSVSGKITLAQMNAIRSAIRPPLGLSGQPPAKRVDKAEVTKTDSGYSALITYAAQ